ncbi:MAG TPA: hypothetical protein VFH96_07100 [Pyrinomonadaceae bacterium]|nr:hypothetical protein [Pyrinomonadaceae bacterium]
MSEDIEIEDASGRLGSITFDRSPRTLTAERTASGFELQLPIEITLRVRLRDDPMLMLSNLRGSVLVKKPDGSPINVGTLLGKFRYTAGISTSEPYSYKNTKYLSWTGTFADLAHIEQCRNGQPPQFLMHVEGEWSFLVPPVLPSASEIPQELLSQELETRLRKYQSFRFLTEPQDVYSRTGNIQVTYPRELWVEMLRRLGVAENVLVEVPLPANPSGPWDDVWQALIDARNAFEQGGSTGWQSTVTSVRRALERWHEIEQEDQGPAWKTPSQSDLKLRTKKQRLDALRWHLRQVAHLAPHSSAEEWTRDDALLMLATLSSLLAERKP